MAEKRAWKSSGTSETANTAISGPSCRFRLRWRRLNIERFVDGEADHLAGGVDSRVGSSGDRRLDLARSMEQRRLEIALDGSHVVLARPAVKACPVVGKVDPVGRHPATRP